MKLLRRMVPFLFFALTACNVSFCGDLNIPRGGLNEYCRFTGASPCDPGLNCNGGRHCVQCGGYGQITCNPIGTDRIDGCNDGLHSSMDTCTYCGEPGQIECHYPGMNYGGECADGASFMWTIGCVGMSSLPAPPVACAGGPNTYSVHCQQAQGCGSILPINATDESSADDCARSLGCDSIPDDPLVLSRAYCVTPTGYDGRPFTVEVPAFSDDAGHACVQSQNIGDTITDGPCGATEMPDAGRD